MISSGQVPSLSYSHATGRISFSAKSWAISRMFSCSSVSVKSTIVVPQFMPSGDPTCSPTLGETAGQQPVDFEAHDPLAFRRGQVLHAYPRLTGVRACAYGVLPVFPGRGWLIPR